MNPQSPQQLVRVSQLSYRYADEPTNTADGAAWALQELTLDLRAGEIMGLIGPDGAGKTTLLRLLAGLLKPVEGSLELLGLDPIRDHSRLSRQVGYMPQRFSLYEDLTVQENMRLCARLRALPRHETLGQEARLLEAAGLASFRTRLAGKLSGGMKQKLALISTLLGQPPLLLLDEPGVGVDPLSRRELWTLVHRARSEGRSILWSTAYLDEAARCDRVCILHRGRLHYLGAPDALLAPLRGRVFTLEPPAAARVALLRQVQGIPGVQDAMLEGPRLRILLRRNATASELPLPYKLHPAEPNFEEAFIDLMGDQHRATAPSVASLEAAAEPTAEIVIRTEGLTRNFGSFVATDHLDLAVHRGEIFGLLGANGAGKTTAFRMMCGLLRPSSGKAEILGIDLARDARRARAHLGYMAQQFSLYRNLSVLQNLRFFASVYGLKPSEAGHRIRELAERYGLGPWLHRNAAALPLGLRQRLSMACAVLHDPALLFLDEPTSGVDPFARRAFWQEINAMAAKGVTIIVTTHFMDEAQYLHRLVIMNHGKVIAQGHPEDLKAAAATQSHPQPTMEEAFIHYVEQGGKP